MALINVTHKPTTATARQFDGTLEAFLDIINARDKAGLTATCVFDGNGDFSGLHLFGGNLGADLILNVGDWILLPADTAQPAASLTNEQAVDRWQAV